MTPSNPNEAAAVAVVQDRRAALVERIGTFADLLCKDPLPGSTGDVAYDLLRQAAAQLSSARLAFQQPGGEKESRLAAIERIASEYENDPNEIYAFDRALNAAYNAGQRSEPTPDAALRSALERLAEAADACADACNTGMMDDAIAEARKALLAATPSQKQGEGL